MATNKNPDLSGKKSFSAVDGFITMVKSQSTARNIKAHLAWMPAGLLSNGKGGYAPLNIHGFLIGETQHKKIPKDWVIDTNDLDLSGLEPEEDGFINLFRVCYPWETEDNKNFYMGTITKLFKVPDNISRRAAPKQQIFVGG